MSITISVEQRLARLEAAVFKSKQDAEQTASAVEQIAAKDYPDVYGEWQSDASYNVGDRVCYNGVLYKVLQAHEAQSGWTPANAPSLFARVLGGQAGTEIAEWTQPDATNPYMKGDKCVFGGTTYESLIDNNVWSPSAYPAGWKVVE